MSIYYILTGNIVLAHCRVGYNIHTLTKGTFENIIPICTYKSPSRHIEWHTGRVATSLQHTQNTIHINGVRVAHGLNEDYAKILLRW